MKTKKKKVQEAEVAKEPERAWHTLEIDTVLQEKEVALATGLSEESVIARRETAGQNSFDKEKRTPLFFQILHHLKDLAVIILIIAGVLALVMDIAAAAGWRGDDVTATWIKAPVIFGIVILNTTLAVIQERGAQKALDALAKLNAPTCFVLRDGIKQEIDAIHLVPGDIIILKTGDLVPADARIIESVAFSVDEASLTGESEPSKKKADKIDKENAPLGDRKNMLFSGCLVATGNATAVVTSTGMNTEMGKIAGFLQTTKKRMTPLQVRITKLGRIICIIAVISALVLLAFELLHGGRDPWHLAFLAVTLAVAAVPEALMVIVTLTLTKGVTKMVKKHVIIRKLPAVETLGSTSVICSDKTGTLTQNKMSITRMWRLGEDPFDTREGLKTEAHSMFLKKLLLCSNVTLEKDTDGSEKIIGDPTESSIMRLCLEQDIVRAELENEYQRVAEIPFSSARKMMTVVVKKPDGKFLVLTKGAFDRLPFDRKDANFQKVLSDVHDSFADDALRLISLAYKEIDKLPPKEKWEAELEKDLIFEGFVGIIDPPRPEAKASIAEARKAGIRTIMITGDHAKTAGAIAKELGIIAIGEGIITGEELNTISDEQLFESVRHFYVYARVSPEDKIRIVQAWKKHGEVVAMTGDGVNDAPALKGADIGIAMGIAGTEVAKSAADMVLTDDNFTSIVSAVKEGRNVFAIIRKIIYFLIVCNFAEIIIMLTGSALGWGLPVTPIMLLIINVIADGVPGLALAKEESDPRVMDRKPFGRKESFFAGGLLPAVIRQSIVTAVVVLAAFFIGSRTTIVNEHVVNPYFATTDPINRYAMATGQLMAFITLGWAAIIHVFTARSRRSIFKINPLKNKQLTFSAIGMMVFVAILALVPWLHSVVLYTRAPTLWLSWQGWLIAGALCIGPILVAEYTKFWDNYMLRSAEKNRVNHTLVEPKKEVKIEDIQEKDI